MNELMRQLKVIQKDDGVCQPDDKQETMQSFTPGETKPAQALSQKDFQDMIYKREMEFIETFRNGLNEIMDKIDSFEMDSIETCGKMPDD